MFLVIHLEINISLQATLSSITCLFTYVQSCQLLHENNKSITSMYLMHTGSPLINEPRINGLAHFRNILKTET